MGQKSNLITLRKFEHNFNLLSYNSKNFVFIFKFLNSLKYLFANKNVWLLSNVVNFISNKLYFTLYLYYKTAKITYYRKKGYTLKTKKKKRNDFVLLFSSFFKLFKNNYINFSIKNLNKEIDTRLLKIMFQKTKRFSGVLFARRFSLYLDFLKITCLFCQNKIKVTSFLFILVQIFRVLPKKSHTKFLSFLKFLFKFIVEEKFSLDDKQENKIQGIKFIIHGKLQGKPRASFSCIQEGMIPIQSFNKNVCFSKLHAYTLMGAFGLRIWVFKD
jgi:hypothetical protein